MVDDDPRHIDEDGEKDKKEEQEEEGKKQEKAKQEEEEHGTSRETVTGAGAVCRAG